ncbi:CapA family protein [Aquabacterium soli]|nr:CapA family protein [Aquabacterium soli]
MSACSRRSALARLAALLAPVGLASWPAGIRAMGAGSASSDPIVSIAIVGDVMLADGPGRVIASGRDPFALFASRLAAADLRIANLECVVAQGGQPEDKPWTFRAHPRVLPVLARHVDVVSVANNHSGDFGRAAFGQMLRRLKDQGVPYFGGGHTLREAHEPLVVERGGLRIALLGYDGFFPRAYEAGEDHPGVAWMDAEHIIEDIHRARTVHRADLVLPFMHWGQEHEPLASELQRRLARQMIDAGADAVIGAHPHVVQDTETYRGKPIVYSLGNFVFDGFSHVDNNTGWLLWLQAGRDGVRRWRVEVARIDKEGVPHPAGPGPHWERPGP